MYERRDGALRERTIEEGCLRDTILLKLQFLTGRV